MILNFLNSVVQFVLDNIIVSFVSSFFTVVGGATPIAILIYLFSQKEKKRLLAHVEEIEKTMPLQEKILKKMGEVAVEKSVTFQNLNENLDNLKKLTEAQNMVEENKKFIKYAKNYDFISAVGNVLRMSNYMPKSISEHKEISKNLPSSLSSDTWLE